VAVDTLRVRVAIDDPEARLAAAAAFDRAPRGWVVSFDPDADADVTVVSAPSGAPDEVVFDPSRPQSVVDSISARATAGAGVVAVTSGVGGAGTSTVALHLAGASARRGLSACLVEEAVGRGLVERARLDRADLPDRSAADDELRGAIIALPCGAHLFAGCEGELAKFTRRAAARYDIVYVDVTPGRVAELDPAAAIAVMPPTIPAAHRTRAVLEGAGGGTWGIVANRLGPGGQSTPGALNQILGRRVLVDLPCTASLRDVEDEGRTLRPGLTRWARRIDLLARTLETTVA
jgi:hypothetical protein